MGLSIVVREKFKGAFEEKCLILAIRAYKTSLTEGVVKLDWDENDISSELHKYIDADPERIRWRISTNVESHIPKDINKTKGFAAKFPRVDFRMTAFVSNHEVKYFLEAKNLRSSSSALKRRYIDTGIDNFVSGKYPKGSLLGYLLDGTPNGVVNGINKLLIKDKRENETLSHRPNNTLDNYFESSHLQIQTLKHLIFDYTSC
ncbi:MAG: hypothetical protein Roseis2KO_53660 [Roseivirga sp.]